VQLICFYSVAKNQHFAPPQQKNYELDQKNGQDWQDELYHHTQFEEIKQRAPAVCAKMWCLFFFLSRSDPTGCTFEGVHSSNDHCVAVYGSILMTFSTFFSREPFQRRHTVLIFVARWCHIIREIGVKNCEKSKNRRKSLCAPLRIDS